MGRRALYTPFRKKLIREKFAELCERLDFTFNEIAKRKWEIEGGPITKGRIYGISRGKVIPPLALVEKLLDERDSVELDEKAAILDEWRMLLGPEGAGRLAGPVGPSWGSDDPIEWLEQKMGLLTAIRDLADPGSVYRLISNRISQEVAARDRENWLQNSGSDRRILIFFRADAPTGWLDPDRLLNAWETMLEGESTINPKITFASVATIPGDGNLRKTIGDFNAALKKRWRHHTLEWYHLQRGSDALDDPAFLTKAMLYGYISFTARFFNLNTTQLTDQRLAGIMKVAEEEQVLWWSHVAKLDGPLALALLEGLGWKLNSEGALQADGDRWKPQEFMVG